ncbi:MAG: hypothetical protein K2O95_02230 [Clostridia bacterium]|nr:hypothetical protein [Clostridia bacterium]
MKNKKFIVVAIIFAAMAVVLTACIPNFGNDDRPAFDMPSMELFDAEVTADSIKIIPDEYYETCTNGEVLEYGLDDEEAWQDSPLFTSLTPNTDYSIRIRVKEDDDHKASDYDYYYATTIKREASELPDVINYTQENRTITIEKNDAWEYDFWGTGSYRSDNSYTYRSSDNGEKTIHVRTKATDEAEAGEPYEIKVYVSGYYSGSGTEEDPFLVYTTEHFKARDTVTKYYNVYIKLMSDLDLTNVKIGKATRSTDNFDGNGHKIKNVSITEAVTGEYIVSKYAGLFPEVKSIKNLTVENVSIQLNAIGSYAYSVGLLAGGAQIVENCSVTGSITIEDNATSRGVMGIGGLVGLMGIGDGDVIVKQSYVNVKIEYNSTTSTSLVLRVGGLFGAGKDGFEETLKVSESAANIDVDLKGFVTAESNRYSGVGGLIGDSRRGSIENSYVTGTIKTNGAGGNLAVGGLMATVYERNRCIIPTVKYCYSNVDINVDGTNQADVVVGGINPMMHSIVAGATVDNCLFAGSITATNLSNNSALGSVYGKDLENMTINDCYHIDSLANNVVVNQSTAVSEATIKSVTWQRETLKFSEEIWTLTEGNYPTLK